MILSASRRTDIPCFYSEWFMNRIRRGYVLTRNPMNHSQISRIDLSPDIVDCIVFWSKDPLPMIRNLSELDKLGYKYYFQFTLTPYDTDIEPNLRPKTDIISTFTELSDRIGRERIVWRYDPIIIDETYDTEYHKNQFSEMCEQLARYTDTVVISFVDLYAKLKNKFIRPVTEAEIAELSEFISETSTGAGLSAVSCCESGLSKYGISASNCIDKARIERIIGSTLNLKEDKNQRENCCCYESIDIGTYNTCINGCMYCYASNSQKTAQQRFREHDPESELLCSSYTDKEKISIRIVHSNKHE
jgi:hypothetical protein